MNPIYFLAFSVVAIIVLAFANSRAGLSGR